ncbi:MAG: polysaccharide biosynthesis protein, partial [Sphaerochaetaceae bacterium]|nr:polysaccharide biosynthesis protein [Sphaerochaetaceae bacterium]
YEFPKRLDKYFGDGRSKVIITGLRPGEKLYEEKLSDKDTTIPTDNPKVFKAKVNGMFDASRLQQLIDALNSSDTDDMLKILQDLVPEFSYQGPVQA